MYGIKGNALRSPSSASDKNTKQISNNNNYKWAIPVNNSFSNEPDLQDLFSVTSLNRDSCTHISQSLEFINSPRQNKSAVRSKTAYKRKKLKVKNKEKQFRSLPTADEYDIDKEHIRVMQQALAAYREHTERNAKGFLARPLSATDFKVNQGPPTPLSVILPRPSSAKITYKNAHRPSSAKCRDDQHLNKEQERHVKNDIYQNESKLPIGPISSLHSPRIRTYSERSCYSEHHVSMDNDIINAVGRANSLDTERPTRDTSRPVLKTQKVDINQSFHNLGLNSSDFKHRRNVFEGTCFSSARSLKKPYYTIHPEWVSESFSVKGLSIQSKRDYTDIAAVPPRRCKSAPPPRSRNPITWENW